MRFVLASAALFIAGCAATPPAASTDPVAAKPAAAAAASPQMAKADEPKKVCRRMMETGSLQPKRVCSTPEEWAEFDRRNKDNSDRIDDQRRAGNTGTNGERPGQ